MDRTFALWLAAGILTFTVAFAGCQEKEEPAPAANPAPAASVGGATTGAGAIAPAPAGGETGPATSAASGETKTAEKQEAGTKKY